MSPKTAPIAPTGIGQKGECAPLGGAGVAAIGAADDGAARGGSPVIQARLRSARVEPSAVTAGAIRPSVRERKTAARQTLTWAPISSTRPVGLWWNSVGLAAFL